MSGRQNEVSVSDRNLFLVCFRMKDMHNTRSLFLDFLLGDSGTCFLVRMLQIISGEEFIEEFLAFSAGFGRFLQSHIASQITGLSLEGDLRAPFAAAFGFIYTADTAGVVFRDAAAADVFYAGAVHEMLCSIRYIFASTAGSVAVHKAGLADTGFIAAAASAFPVVLIISFSIICEDREVSKFLPYPVLQGRVAQAAAAAAIAV